MSKRRFLQTLQALLTMVDPDRKTSVACVKSTLENLFALAWDSHKCDGQTLRMMHAAVDQIEYLIHHREDFAGIPGDSIGNQHKQDRLGQILFPAC